LQSEHLKVETIKAGAESALFALAHQIPRKIDAYCNSSVRFLRIKYDALNALRNPSVANKHADIVVAEPDDDDWISMLLQSPIFSSLSAVGLQQTILGLREVVFQKNELIIEQGKQGGFFYFIKEGNCLLSHTTVSSKPELIKLQELGNQETFGEDSLISEEPSQISVKAITKVAALRLNKEKFISFIKESYINYISHSQIKDELEKNALIIDVRHPHEFKNRHLPGCVNIPYFLLRKKLEKLDKKRSIVLICNNGKRSEAAAFLLQSNEFTALVVEGGLKNKYQKTEDVEQNKSRNNEDVSVSIDQSDESSILQFSEKTKEDDKNATVYLKMENQQLKQAVKGLKEEKAELERKYRALFKQMEKLKAVFDAQK
jgi:rhodanese-related sulfurtransferase